MTDTATLPIRTLRSGPRVTESTIEDVVGREAIAVFEKEDFKPVRVWTGGPGAVQEKILVPGTLNAIKPRPDGSYLLKTPAEVAIVKRALGGRFWVDTVPEDEDSPVCNACKWTSRSYAAMNWHQNNAHGRPQAANG